MLKQILFYSCSVTLLFCGCNNNEKGLLTEGVINYEVTLINKDYYMAYAAPSAMTFEFKDSKCRGVINAGPGGIVTTTFISDPEKKIFSQLFQMGNKKFVHAFDDGEMQKENEGFPLHSVKRTDETKVIAGYKCKKVVYDFKDESIPDFDVYYTNDLAVKSPNWASPFKEVDGILMEYQVNKYGLILRFTATALNHVKVESSDFEVPNDHKVVTSEYLESLIPHD